VGKFDAIMTAPPNVAPVVVRHVPYVRDNSTNTKPDRAIPRYLPRQLLWGPFGTRLPRTQPRLPRSSDACSPRGRRSTVPRLAERDLQDNPHRRIGQSNQDG